MQKKQEKLWTNGVSALSIHGELGKIVAHDLDRCMVAVNGSTKIGLPVLLQYMKENTISWFSEFYRT